MEKRGLEVAVEVPASVREALGDRAALDLVSWFIRVIPSVAATKEEFKEVIVRLDNLEKELKNLRAEMDKRFEAVDRRFEEIERRFEAVDNRFETVHARIDAVHDRIDALRKDMDERIDVLRRDIDERFDSFQRSMEHRLDLIQERMLTQSRWLVGSIAVLGTVISILLAIGQFLR